MGKKGQEQSNLTRFERFVSEVINRANIKNAPYNPRIIGKETLKRLKKAIQKHGMVSAITVNRRTMNIVGGHQRLDILDALEGRGDYDLTVNMIDVDEREEKILNVQLNNPSMQGEWDLDKLAGLKIEDDINFEEMGFTDFDVDTLFDGDSRFSKLFEDTEEAKKTKDKLADIKKDREEWVNGLKKDQSADFYFFVVCGTQVEKEELLKRLGYPTSEEYVRGEILSLRLKE